MLPEVPPASFPTKKPEWTRRRATAFALIGAIVVAAMSLLTPQSLRHASASTSSVPSLKDQTNSLRRMSLPLSRDVVISDCIASSTPSKAQVSAHFLFTRAIERKLRAQRIQANSTAAASETVIYNGGPVMEG